MGHWQKGYEHILICLGWKTTPKCDDSSTKKILKIHKSSNNSRLQNFNNFQSHPNFNDLNVDFHIHPREEKRAKFKQGKKWKLAAIDFLYFGFRLTVGRCYSFYLFRECKHLTPLSVCFSSKWFFLQYSARENFQKYQKTVCFLCEWLMSILMYELTHIHRTALVRNLLFRHCSCL